MFSITVNKDRSSLVSMIDYDPVLLELTVHFHNYYVPRLTYINVDLMTYGNFIMSKSIGKFYLRFIKPSFELKKHNVMADKIIKCKIDVSKINKEWLFTGEKGVYLDFTILYNEEKDKYENNGMIVQDVPSAIYKADKTLKGVILGNCKEFGGNPPSKEAIPGVESGSLGLSKEIGDDLPF